MQSDIPYEAPYLPRVSDRTPHLKKKKKLLLLFPNRRILLNKLFIRQVCRLQRKIFRIKSSLELEFVAL